jgi:NADH-quinone oxidoreductase subunit N
MVGFFAGGANKIYLYLLMKIIFTIDISNQQLQYFSYFFVFSIVCATYAAFKSKGIKLLIVASIAQLSYMIFLIPLSIEHDHAFIAMIFLIFSHALSIPVLFLYQHRKQNNNISKILVFYNIANCIGLPFTLGFIAKWYLFVSVLESSYWYIFMLIVISSSVALLYYLRLWYDDEEKSQLFTSLDQKGTTASILLTLLSIILCVFSNNLINWIIK